MRYLNFSLDNKEYGVPLEQVREVIAFPKIHQTPSAPKNMLGIINLREQIIPIVDLRLKFGIQPTLTHDTAVIICKIENWFAGVIVDCIFGVQTSTEKENLSLGQLDNKSMSSSLVSNVISKEDKLILIVDIGKIISANDVNVKDLQDTIHQLKSVV